MRSPGLCLGAGTLQHWLGPVHPRDPKAEIVHQVRNDASAAGEIERGTPLAGAQCLRMQLMPGVAFLLGENLMSGRLVESRRALGPICLDLGAQVISSIRLSSLLIVGSDCAMQVDFLEFF